MQAARAAGSIFETLLSETLEAMLPLHSLTADGALRRHAHWQDAYVSAARDGTFAARRTRYTLMAPRKRRILIKLLAARALTEAAGRGESRRRAAASRPVSPAPAAEYPYDSHFDDDGEGGFLSWDAEAMAAPDDPLSLDRLAAMVGSLVADSVRALAVPLAPAPPRAEAEDLHFQLEELLYAWTDLLDAHAQGDLPDQVRDVGSRL